MHVTIANVTSGGLSGGSVKYLQRLCPLLAANRIVRRLDVFVPPATVDSLAPRLGSELRTWPASDPFEGFLRLREEIRQLQPDVLFIPSARWLDCRNVPTAIMVRNMEPLVAPYGGNPWKEKAKNFFRARAARSACRRADAVVAVSQFVRDFLVGKWRMPRERIQVVCHGADSPGLAARPPARLAESPVEPFLFTAGSIRPYRGLEDAIRALAVLRSCGISINLAVAGTANLGTESYERHMRSLAERLQVASQVVWLGQLDAEQMAWCFANARAFVMTSRVEACPNVVLEAMQHGSLSVSTDQPPMPEFFGPTAWYYRAGNGESLAEQLKTVLAAPAVESETMRASARQRVQQFNWSRTAQETVELLARIAGRGLSQAAA